MKITKSNQEKNKKENYKTILKRVKKEVKGITLIALVVTIIVLLILAGVAISLTVGDNGLFKRAQNAADTWQMAEQNEQKEMDQAGNFLDDYTSEYNKATTVSYAKQLNKPFENDTTITDDLDNEVRIPAGFKIASDSATLVEDGIVIEDKDGNQFVWIPARTEDEEGNEAGATIKLSTGGTATIVYKRTAYATNIATGVIDEETGSEKINYSSTNENYYTEALINEEENSVNANGGYYIGRYEAGDKQATEDKKMREETSEQTDTMVIKKGQVPYNWISYSNAKDLAENMDNIYEYKQTTKLASSYAWDTAIAFIQIKNEDYGMSSEEGNYSDTTFKYIDINDIERTKNINEEIIVPTGQTTSVSNIYDMGGNIWEYTSENRYDQWGKIYTNRGGRYGVPYTDSPAGIRNSYTGEPTDMLGFRVTLYL